MALRMVLRWGLLLGALGWTAYQMPPLVRSASGAADVLGRLSWGWVVGAALLGLAAVGLYAELHRQLLAVGGARPPAAAVQSITFAQNAIGNTVPVVGGAGALAYAVGRLRRRGVDAALATWAVLLAGLLSVLCLLVLGAGALTATGVLPPAGAAAVVAGVAAAAAAIWMLGTHPAVLRGAVGRLLGLWRRLPRRGPAESAGGAADVRCVADRAAARLRLLRPSPRQWLQLLAVTALTWLLDFANLAVAAAAVPGSVHWSALVQGFLVVQASIALQVLPGGAGLAELGLLGALLGSGVGAGPAAVVVLIYRTSSWFLPSALGWLTYGVQLQLAGRRPPAPPARIVEPPHEHHLVPLCQLEDGARGTPAGLPVAA
jgi:putative heme transporter